MTEERRNEKYERRGMGRLFSPVKAFINWLAGGKGRARLCEDWIAMLPGGVKLELVWVEGGSFKMDKENYWVYTIKRPFHQVTLTKGYWIGKYLFMQGQWKAVGASKRDSNCWNGDQLPVERVSWDEAFECCNKLNEQLSDKIPSGYCFALPTEAQWEFAARGGVKSHGYEYSGSNNIDEVAWYDDNSDGHTHEVGLKLPNELGIYDMTGNVWEWCHDWYDYYPSESVTDPIGPSSGSGRVYRGGSWDDIAIFCRSMCRNEYDPSRRYTTIGFRVALVPVS